MSFACACCGMRGYADARGNVYFLYRAADGKSRDMTLLASTDGGKTFKKLAKGLPGGQLGRIGLDWYRKDANIVFAIIESEKIGMGPKGARPVGNGYLGIAGRTRSR